MTRRSAPRWTRRRPMSPRRSAAIANLQAQERLQAANIAAAEAQLDGSRATARAQPAGGRPPDEAARDPDRRHRAGGRAGGRRGEALGCAGDAGGRRRRGRTAAARGAAHPGGPARRQPEGGAGGARSGAINLGYTRITAPIDGMVGQRRVYPGQYVGIGTQVIAVVPLRHVYVIANYKETQLTHLRARAAGGNQRRYVPRRRAARPRGILVAGAPARSSRCCRPTTRPATSPRSCSASR